jgi:hypothetical protein
VTAPRPHPIRRDSCADLRTAHPKGRLQPEDREIGGRGHPQQSWLDDRSRRNSS